MSSHGGRESAWRCRRIVGCMHSISCWAQPGNCIPTHTVSTCPSDRASCTKLESALFSQPEAHAVVSGSKGYLYATACFTDIIPD